VSRFVQDKGFGFIKPDEGDKEVFFHQSAFTGQPKEGQAVEFDLEQSDRGPRASNVRPV
jgi:CspA family cold shock protein